MRRSIVRKGCLGCLGSAAGALLLVVAIWLFAPGLLDRVVDWALFVDPPDVQVAPNGARQVKNAITSIYAAAEGDRKVDRVEISEGAFNGFLAPEGPAGAVKDARVDLGDNDMTLYAAIDLKDASDGEYADLLADVPALLKDRRVSVRVDLTRVTTAGDRLTFEGMDVTVGRVWLPFSAAWALPVLQRMAERQLGTRVPEKGIPVPSGSTATIAGDKLTVTIGPSAP
jgi:hypothetical protein